MRIHHLALRTRDPERLAAFYEEALGLTRVHDATASGTWLRAGDAVLMVERAEEGEPAVPHGSLELFAFAVAALEMEAVRERLAAHGVAVEGATRFTIYVRDPDGRRVGVSSYPLPED